MVERNIVQSGRDQESLEPETLAEVLEGKQLLPREMRAAQAADVMNISFRDRRILFGAYVYIQAGIFRVRDLIGTSPQQTVDMRDRVITNESYEQAWRRFNLLLRPNFLEVAAGKKQKKQHGEIAREQGLEESQVDEISRYLIEAGIIQISPRGKGRANEFKRVVELVEREDSSRRKDGLRETEREIAERLGVSPSTVKRARRRIRIREGSEPLSPKFSKKPNHEAVHQRRTKVLEGSRRGLTNSQISNEYGIPIGTVKDDRAWLRKRKDVPKVVYLRDSNREKMREILQAHLLSHPPGTIINLKEIQRSGAIAVSYTGIWNLYNDIASEQEVPPIRKITRRKKS